MDFSEESVKKSRGKELANERGLKFILGSVLVLPSNWFPLTRVKWLPLMENSFAVSGIVIAELGVRATTRSETYMGSSSIGSEFQRILKK
ncbi:hypothetical protein Tco_1157985 [Tanacetum coccineum]